MNKNKLIFAIIWALLLVFILFTVMTLQKSSEWTNTSNTSSDFTIWLIAEKDIDPYPIIENFKKINPDYSSSNIVIEKFTNYEDYYYTLSSALSSDKWPDVFVLNNNEKNSIFSNQATWVHPDVLNPNDFRKKFKWVFSDDLILTYDDWEEVQEFLAWVPVWYETLWIFYNRRYVKDSDLTSISSLNNKVSELKTQKPSLIPIWIWNWSTVKYAGDILAQFFMLENDVAWLSDLIWNTLKQWIVSYLLYWDVDWYNSYDSRFMELSNLWQNSIDLFSRWETFMVVWYPRLIKEIKEKWFSKNFLLASAFPHYYSWDWSTLVNYDYFVINKDSLNQDLANAFLSYLSTDIWAENYLSVFSYYLPALLSLESDKLEDKIDEDFNLVLWDFFNNEYNLSSFDKWIKNLYDKWVISVLDNWANYENAFSDLKNSILCKTKKIVSLENLSEDCE